MYWIVMIWLMPYLLKAFDSIDSICMNHLPDTMNYAEVALYADGIAMYFLHADVIAVSFSSSCP